MSDLVTDGSDPRLHETNPLTGQKKAYLILSDEERAKGFVRPVRQSYYHTTCGVRTRMSLELAETYARQPTFYGATFCVKCRAHLPVSEFLWVDGPADGTITDQTLGS